MQQFCRTSVHNCNVYAAVHVNDSRFSKMEEDQDMLQACVEDLTAIIDKNGKADFSSFTFWPRFEKIIIFSLSLHLIFTTLKKSLHATLTLNLNCLAEQDSNYFPL